MAGLTVTASVQGIKLVKRTTQDAGLQTTTVITLEVSGTDQAGVLAQFLKEDCHVTFEKIQLAFKVAK